MEKMNVNLVKFRCSSLGKIMTESEDKITEKQLARIEELTIRNIEYCSGIAKKKLTDNMWAEWDELKAKRDAPPQLGKTCITYLQELYIGLRYGRKKDITSRYIDKGLAVEEDSFTLASLAEDKLYIKNKKQFDEDPDITGMPDHLEEETVNDIKSSWDIFTFFAVLLSALNKIYYWQLQGYMVLTKKRLANLIYCLTNTPEIMLQDQKKRLAWKLGILDPEAYPEYLAACEDIDRLGKYDDIPTKDRIKKVAVIFEPKAEAMIRARVKECRQYLLKTYPDFFYES